MTLRGDLQRFSALSSVAKRGEGNGPVIREGRMKRANEAILAAIET